MNTLSQKKERGVCVHVTSHKLIVSSFDITGSRSAVGKVSATDVSLTAYPGFVSSIPKDISYCFNQLMDNIPHLIWNAFKLYALHMCKMKTIDQNNCNHGTK